MTVLRDLVEELGRRALRLIAEVGAVSVLAGQTCYHAVIPPYSPRLLLAQMDHIGVRSVTIVGVAGLFVGLVRATREGNGLIPSPARTGPARSPSGVQCKTDNRQCKNHQLKTEKMPGCQLSAVSLKFFIEPGLWRSIW